MATAIENIVGFGDSIAMGFGTSQRVGWMEKLRAHFYSLNRHNPHAVFTNLAYPGDTSSRLVERTEILPSLMRRGRAHLSVVAIGPQDIWQALQEHPQDRLPTYGDHPVVQQVYENTIRAAQKLGQHGLSLVVGPTICRTNFAGLYGYDRQESTGGDAAIHQALSLVGERVRDGFEVAAAYPVVKYLYVDLLESSATDPRFTHTRDGIHPDEQGQEWIFERLIQPFEKLVNISPDSWDSPE